MRDEGMSRPVRLVQSRHDLPPSWDGQPVEWDEWSPEDSRTTLVLHVPAHELACHECGSVDEPRISWGKRPPESPTITTTRTKTTRSGHQYEAPAEVEAWSVRDLVAARCRHCLHDVVTDTRTGESWDLEEEDYGPDGSTASDVLF
ncbi:hypothetical protein SEA_BRYNNIE_28 [Arthrobacter phage Brynnie]|nr:hypothetical protein SEA_BRYNNIE_28 [Arthrobacter phage Brynnie]